MIRDIKTILDTVVYKNKCISKMKEHNIDIGVEEKFDMLYIKYNGREFMLRYYKDLNIILKSIIKGNIYTGESNE